MAATDMRLAGLEPGCKVEVRSLNQITGALSVHEARRLHELFLRNPLTWTYEGPEQNSSTMILITQGTRSEIVYVGDVQREYTDAQATRHERFYKLVEAYPHHVDNATESDTIERYCGIQQHGRDGEFSSHLTDTFDDVATMLANDIFEGWMPEAIFDLDTGQRIELHVSSPIITKSEDQGVMENVLEQEVS